MSRQIRRPARVTTPPDPLMTFQECAAYLRVPERTLRDWRAKGLAPRAIKAGRAVLFRLSDVDAWLDEHAERAG